MITKTLRHFLPRNPVSQALWAMVLTAIYKTGDYLIQHDVFPAKSLLENTFAYLLLGGIIGTVVCWILCFIKPVRTLIDPQATEMPFMDKNPIMHKRAIFCGLFNAAATGCLFYTFTANDVGWAISLTNLSSVVILLLEGIPLPSGLERVRRILRIPRIALSKRTVIICIIAAIGAFVLGIGKIDTTHFQSNISMFVWLAVAGNIVFSAYGEIQEKPAVEAVGSFRFLRWRLFWLAIGAVIISLYIAPFILGVNTSNVVNKALQFPMPLFTTIAAIVTLMIFVNVSHGFRLRAKGSKSNTWVATIVSASGVAVFAIAWVVSRVALGNLLGFPKAAFSWVLEIVGAIIITGALALLTMERPADVPSEEDFSL